MINIRKATEQDYSIITEIGTISVADAHRASCSAEDLDEYIGKHYSDEAIKKELADRNNIYHIIKYNEVPAGFSKIVLNAQHANVERPDTTKLDRIYLLKEFQGHKLGLELLNFIIEFCRKHDQSGIWLFTWIGNEKAISFYKRAGFTIIGSHRFKVTENHSNDNHQMFLELN